MSDHRYTVFPRADRYGHPEGVKSAAPALTINEHGVAAPHCDKYGHVVGDEQRRVKSAAESRSPKSEFVLR
jgi:hypothetical protein